MRWKATAKLLEAFLLPITRYKYHRAGCRIDEVLHRAAVHRAQHQRQKKSEHGGTKPAAGVSAAGETVAAAHGSALLFEAVSPCYAAKAVIVHPHRMW